MSEGSLQRTIRETVNLMPGCLFWNQPINHRQRRTGIPEGTPDLIGYCPGPSGLSVFLGLEVKTEAGLKGRSGNPKTRAAQLKWRDRAERDGAVVAVVSSGQEALAVILRIRQWGLHSAPHQKLSRETESQS